MKCVILDGTHDKNGMTSLLIESFAEGLKSFNSQAEIKRISLIDENISFCRGCSRCSSVGNNVIGKCVVNDSAESIKKEALDCDILVLASPVYEYCVTSAMKRFLERCLGLVGFTFGPSPKMKPVKGKKGLVLCATGAPYPANKLMGITRYPEMMLKFSARLFGCSEIKKVFAGGMRGSKKAEKLWVCRVREIAGKFSNN